ncbi:hypothetical protein CE91St46_14670 [Eubacteriales bacterium]|nr:hypothetical protein CE91St46_14670 [Eubacteriales bacterium]GKH62993.1 hypothetical protein CE91St47_14620 [Eubacteriales bacterium]
MADMVKRKDFLTDEVVDLSDEIKLVSPTDTPLTTMLMGRGAVVPATDITVTWREKQLDTTRGTLIKEGADAGTVIVSSRSSISNLCQITEKVTQVSGTARALHPKGVGDTFDAEVSDRLIELKRDMEWYFLNGTKTVESDTAARQMNGLVNLVNTKNVISTAGALSEDHFLDAFQKMWDHGAQGEYFAFVNATQKRAINALAKAGSNVRWVIENGSVTNEWGVGVSKIVSDFGTINLVLDRHMDAATILALDLDEVQIAELRSTFYEDLPKAGDYYKGHIINESTIKLLNSYAGAKILVTAAPSGE